MACQRGVKHCAHSGRKQGVVAADTGVMSCCLELRVPPIQADSLQRASHLSSSRASGNTAGEDPGVLRRHHLRWPRRCEAMPVMRSRAWGPRCTSCPLMCLSTSLVTTPITTSLQRTVAGLLSSVTPRGAASNAGCGNTGRWCTSWVDGTSAIWVFPAILAARASNGLST